MMLSMLALLSSPLMGSPGSGVADARGSAVIVQCENDVFAGRDRHYTSGIQVGALILGEELGGCGRRIVRSLDEWFPRDRERSARRYGIFLGQRIFTPENLESETLVEDDRPYAGWLSVVLAAQQENRGVAGGGASGFGGSPSTLDSFELELGVIGPWSLAERAQKGLHEIGDAQVEPNGWDGQLKNEVAFDVRYERRWRVGGEAPLDLSWDMIPRAGVSIGLAETALVAGATARIGSGRARDFGLSTMRGTRVASFGRAARGFWWELHAGCEGRVVFHDVFLEGNNFRASHGVSVRPAVWEGRAGARIGWGDASLGCVYVLQGETFEGQDGPDAYAALVFGLAF